MTRPFLLVGVTRSSSYPNGQGLERFRHVEKTTTAHGAVQRQVEDLACKLMA